MNAPRLYIFAAILLLIPACDIDLDVDVDLGDSLQDLVDELTDDTDDGSSQVGEDTVDTTDGTSDGPSADDAPSDEPEEEDTGLTCSSASPLLTSLPLSGPFGDVRPYYVSHPTTSAGTATRDFISFQAAVDGAAFSAFNLRAVACARLTDFDYWRTGAREVDGDLITPSNTAWISFVARFPDSDAELVYKLSLLDGCTAAPSSCTAAVESARTALRASELDDQLGLSDDFGDWIAASEAFQDDLDAQLLRGFAPPFGVSSGAALASVSSPAESSGTFVPELQITWYPSGSGAAHACPQTAYAATSTSDEPFDLIEASTELGGEGLDDPEDTSPKACVVP